MRTGTRTGAWVAGLLVALALVVLVSAGVGPVEIRPTVVAKVLLNAVAVPASVGVSTHGVPVAGASVPVPRLGVAFAHPFSYGVESTHEVIVMKLRLPRIALGALVGFSLAAAGVVMQGFFRNPMADPSIIGVSSGAAVGAVASIVAPVAVPFGLGLQGAAFLGALVTAFGVYLLATENGRTPVATLLLAGVAVQTFLGAVISFMLLHSGESIREVVYWLMGHLDDASWDEVAMAGVLAPLFFLVLLAYARDLNVLLLGEEDAQGLGIEVERTKRVLLAVASVVTAVAVSVSGVIGFVGLVVPHVMRLLVGPDHRILLPTSALAGASFLVAADTVARSGTAELPVGIVTAALGAPFFLYLLRTREVHAL
ncbi:vitamin B12 ABC transporter permease BtuC [Halegenticoccus tardaugens]|uniref:vitamin B12 ABC transporter permease BtuC n=1 Tax=Halegenticoccus tardaugens TaxID=2071624 RepID=UPI00100AE107|nr:vitamin B12 ABC transporter permease BtuC [Halegenticoccus tardaugens]